MRKIRNIGIGAIVFGCMLCLLFLFIENCNEPNHHIRKLLKQLYKTVQISEVLLYTPENAEEIMAFLNENMHAKGYLSVTVKGVSLRSELEFWRDASNDSLQCNVRLQMLRNKLADMSLLLQGEKVRVQSDERNLDEYIKLPYGWTQFKPDLGGWSMEKDWLLGHLDEMLLVDAGENTEEHSPMRTGYYRLQIPKQYTGDQTIVFSPKYTREAVHTKEGVRIPKNRIIACEISILTKESGRIVLEQDFTDCYQREEKENGQKKGKYRIQIWEDTEKADENAETSGMLELSIDSDREQAQLCLHRFLLYNAISKPLQLDAQVQIEREREVEIDVSCLNQRSDFQTWEECLEEGKKEIDVWMTRLEALWKRL